MRTSRLHLAPDRRQVFARLEPKVWLDTSLLRTWVIAEPALVIALLRHPDAVILDINDMLDALERAYAIDFPHVRYAARQLPLFLEGDRHCERRRRFSRYLSARLPELEAQLPELLDRHLSPLRRKGRFDLVKEVTGPLVHAINEVFVGQALSREAVSLDLLDLFALNKNIARFRDLDQRVAKAVAMLDPKGQAGDVLDERFTALIMGFETLLTLLTEGLVSAFEPSADPDKSPAATLPALPVETGVPVSHRRAARDFQLSGHQFKAGDLLRLQLQPLGYVPAEAERIWMFGAGAHSCVGKHVALRIWTETKAVFDAMQVHGRLISYELASSHYLVRHRSVEIEVTG